VGTDEERIVARASALLSGNGAAAVQTPGHFNPYGDGLASERIAAILTGRPFTPFAPPA
jgi:UDP-N-acetylglucosamine 2-epimerase